MRVFFTILAISFVFTSSAQMNITTPNGFSDLYVEMSTAELLRVMGQPEKIKTFESEERLWKVGGYETERSIVFVHGFDKVYQFEQNNKYCLWKAYIKDDKVIYMNLTTQYVDDYYKSRVTVNGKIHFGDRPSKVREVLGTKYYKDMDWKYIDYLYHDMGIRFTFRQSRITNIYLYRPFDNRADLMRMIRHYKSEISE